MGTCVCKSCSVSLDTRVQELSCVHGHALGQELPHTFVQELFSGQEHVCASCLLDHRYMCVPCVLITCIAGDALEARDTHLNRAASHMGTDVQELLCVGTDVGRNTCEHEPSCWGTQVCKSCLVGRGVNVCRGCSEHRNTCVCRCSSVGRDTCEKGCHAHGHMCVQELPYRLGHECHT